ncbi:sensor domain-containing diguanylate cyclase [Candidatus Magnetomonas plexicatena]|uniref:sensor domain-containing diguanylate cyclase n=1 Tax=Candidatus Magnetomonas plexicatena TaxID=2552947 RepID=UPI001C759FC0|nr:diguanylate cyclase [Nitrospirales bacterium LBB_01]
MSNKLSVHNKYALIIWVLSISLVFIMLSAFYFAAHKYSLSFKVNLQNQSLINYEQYKDIQLSDFLQKQDEMLNQQWRVFDNRLLQTGLLILLAVIAVSIALSVIMSKRLSAPLIKLQNAAMAVYSGEKPDPIPMRGNNEFSNFIRLFNEMTLKIANYTDELERSVKERTRELDDNSQIQQVLNTILKIAIEPTPLKEKLQNVLDLLFSVSWISLQKKGCIFLTDNKSQSLIMAAERNLHPELLRQCSVVPFGKCLCGRAATSGGVVFADCITDSHDVRFDGMAQHGHYCIAIKSGSKIYGVLNLYIEHGHRRSPLEEEFLTAVANSLTGIIEHGMALDAINQSNMFIHTVLNSMNDSLVVIDVNDFKILEANEMFYKEYALEKEEVIGNTCYNVIHRESLPCSEKEHLCPIATTVKTGDFARAEHIHYNKNGRKIYVGCSSSPIKDESGKTIQCVYMLRDISERKRFEKQLEQMAHYDNLTCLPNRTLFVDRLSGTLEMAKREKHQSALLFIDLDRFKNVNDTLGHDGGDLLLKEVAKRLLKSVRKTDTVSRLGGDEFTVILSKVKDIESIIMVADKIISLLNEPFLIKGSTCHIGASIGIETYPFKHATEDKKKVEVMLKHADIAVYEVKNFGRNKYKFYDENS